MQILIELLDLMTSNLAQGMPCPAVLSPWLQDGWVRGDRGVGVSEEVFDSKQLTTIYSHQKNGVKEVR